MYKIFGFAVFVLLLSSGSASYAFKLCDDPVRAIKDISATGYYTDSKYSVIDYKKKALLTEQTAPITLFTNTVSGFADDYLAHKKKRAVSCAVKWLNTWALNEALLGEMKSSQAQYVRIWALDSITLSYLKIKPGVDKDRANNIEKWISDLANVTLSFKDKLPKNNLTYYLGLGLMGAGVATDRPDLINEALIIYDQAMEDIQEDGSLPKEMGRGKRALVYHNYSLEPLVIMSELSRLIGQDWYSRHPGKLSKLAEIVIKGNNDPTLFQEKTGEVQDIIGSNSFGWAEFAEHFYKDTEEVKPLLKTRPFISPKLGGNLTNMAKMNYYSATHSKPE